MASSKRISFFVGIAVAFRSDRQNALLRCGIYPVYLLYPCKSRFRL